jgi:hypothetical protein
MVAGRVQTTQLLLCHYDSVSTITMPVSTANVTHDTPRRQLEDEPGDARLSHIRPPSQSRDAR